MSAFNWIKCEDVCPSCKSKSVIRSQVHTCSAYDGDESGRFHERTYRLGQKMAWWQSNDPRFPEWIESNINSVNSPVSNTECCYSECVNCNAELFVILEFKDCVAEKVLDIGLEVKWPVEYLK